MWSYSRSQRVRNPFLAEVAWFLLKMTESVPKSAYADQALNLIEGSLNEGWDWDHGGGLLYIMDIGGR